MTSGLLAILVLTLGGDRLSGFLDSFSRTKSKILPDESLILRVRVQAPSSPATKEQLGALRALSQRGMDVKLFKAPKRGLKSALGVAGGRQWLLDRLKAASYIMFLDDDVKVLDPDWFDPLLRALHRHPTVGIVGPGGAFVRMDWSGFVSGAPGRVDVVAGYCQLFRAELALQLGCRLEQGYNPFWHEDSDFCLQARALGWEVFCAPAGLIHKPSHSGDSAGAERRNFELFRQRWKGKGLVRAEEGRGNGAFC